MNGTGTHGAGTPSAALGAPMARGIPVGGERGHVMTFTPMSLCRPAKDDRGAGFRLPWGGPQPDSAPTEAVMAPGGQLAYVP